MRTPTTEREPAKPRWLSFYGPVANELAATEEVLRSELRSENPFVDQLVKHAFRLGGKRLRPALLLLAGKATGELNRDHIVLAAVVEMIHTATLVHDDVLDEAAIRRHDDTINARNGNEASVLVGDFLFTHAFSLAASLETTYACQSIGRSTNIVCTGELRQINTKGNYSLTEAEYLEIIDGKTAELCACCCRLGAHYAGGSATIEDAFDRYGRYLGIAFQIADDLLDLVGDPTQAGKSLGTDLEKQKPTLPLIQLLATCSEAEQHEILSLCHRDGAEARGQLAARMKQSGAFDYARRRAQQYADQALAELRPLPNSPAKDVLAELTRLVVSRHE
jgi:octaprenyl-diphosphate synthase